MKQSIELLTNHLIRYVTHLDRIAILWYCLIAWMIIILMTTFSYTIIDYNYFSKAAERQQKMIIKNPVSRGNILSSEASLHGILGVSTNLGTLAIDPTQTGSMEKLLPFLSDIIYRDFCETHSSLECTISIGNYIRKDLTETK